MSTFAVPCLDCGTPVRGASRCEPCRLSKQRQRDAQRGKTTDRGYGYSWQRARAEAIARAPWCVDCGHRGSEDNPLTGDHVQPVSKSGTERGGIVVRCRKCNSSRGNRPLGGQS